MSTIIHPPEHGRYYAPDRGVILEVPCVSKPGEMREPTITDCIKNHWFPSFSEVGKLMAKPRLVSFQVESAIRASIKLQRGKDETDDQFVVRCSEESKVYSVMRRERGTEMHLQLQRWFTEKEEPKDPACQRAKAEIVSWLDCHGFTSSKGEVSFINTKKGWAGTADLVAEGAGGYMVADFKTTSLSSLKTPYEEWGLQLACYWDGLDAHKTAFLVSIPIDQDTGETRFYTWGTKATPKSKSPLRTNDSLLAEWKNWFEIWCLKNEYWPHKS